MAQKTITVKMENYLIMAQALSDIASNFGREVYILDPFDDARRQFRGMAAEILQRIGYKFQKKGAQGAGWYDDDIKVVS